MSIRICRLLVFGLIALYAAGPPPANAQQIAEERAASLLFRNYETVVGSNTQLILSLSVINSQNNPSSNEGVNKPRPGEQTLRFPFLPLIAALKDAGPNLTIRLRQSYRVVLVGAKDFTSPAGLGLVHSRNCFIALLKEGSKPITASDFPQGSHLSINGIPAWKWFLAPYEGQPAATEFFAAHMAGGFLVVANNQKDFNQITRGLTSASSASAFSKIEPKWDVLNKHEYWAHRVFNRTRAADRTDSAISDLTGRILEITFIADSDRDQGKVQMVSTDAAVPKVFSKLLP